MRPCPAVTDQTPRRRRPEVGELIDDQSGRIVRIERQLAVVLAVRLHAQQRARCQAPPHAGDVVVGALVVEEAVVGVLDQEPRRQRLPVDAGRGGERRARVEVVRQPEAWRPVTSRVEREVVEAAAEGRGQSRADRLFDRGEGARLAPRQRHADIELLVARVDARPIGPVEQVEVAEQPARRHAPRQRGPAAGPVAPVAAQHHLLLAGVVVEQDPRLVSRRFRDVGAVVRAGMGDRGLRIPVAAPQPAPVEPADGLPRAGGDVAVLPVVQRQVDGVEAAQAERLQSMRRTDVERRHALPVAVPGNGPAGADGADDAGNQLKIAASRRQRPRPAPAGQRPLQQKPGAGHARGDLAVELGAVALALGDHHHRREPVAMLDPKAARGEADIGDQVGVQQADHAARRPWVGKWLMLGTSMLSTTVRCSPGLPPRTIRSLR